MNEQWKRYAELEQRERELAAELDRVKAEKNGLEPGLLDQMAEESLDRITINGFTILSRKTTTRTPCPATYAVWPRRAMTRT